MDSTKRSILKAVSWRCWATTETVFIGWLITGSVKSALAIGAADFCMKIVTYFVHERLWNRIAYGRPKLIERDWEI